MTIGNSFAATNRYNLKMDLSLNGKPTSSPSLIVNEGEIAKITQRSSNGDENFIEVIASRNKDGKVQNSVLMKFTIGTVEKSGKKIIFSKPQIIAKENEIAMISQKNNNGPEQIALSVIATTLKN